MTITLETPIRGIYQSTTMVLNVPSGTPGTTSIFNFSFPMDLHIWETVIGVRSSMIDDSITIIAAPDTQIGVLTAAGNIGDKVLTVSSTVFTLPNIELSRGMNISLMKIGFKQDLGRVTDLDANARTITFENALSETFLSHTSIIQLNLRILQEHIFDIEGNAIFGKTGIWTRKLPKGFQLQYLYTNNSADAKTVRVHVHYHYE